MIFITIRSRILPSLGIRSLVRRSSLSGYRSHPFHIVDQSGWPLLTSWSSFVLTWGGVLYFHGSSSISWILGLLCTGFAMVLWTREVAREATFLGFHTQWVVRGLKWGMLLFIVSELMFFVAWFWAYLYSCLSPAIEGGSVWPPAYISPLVWSDLPLANTLLLLLSGGTLTLAHHSLVLGSVNLTRYLIILTTALAMMFTAVQGIEYWEAPFAISDGVYGSTFFMATGFHGFHVIVGAVLILATLVRLGTGSFSTSHHVGFEASAWYWHFVDVVWLFLFILIYCWV